MDLELGQLDRRYASLRIDDRERRGRLAASLAQHGQQTPVLVMPTDTVERWVLVDGYVRARALEEIGRDLVRAAAIAIDETQALVMSHRLDNARRRTALEEGWLLRELERVHGRDLGALSVLLGRSRSWVSRRLGLVRALPAPVQDAVRRGEVSPYVAMKYLLPMARANDEQCMRLVERLGARSPTARQMQRLYTAWRTSDREGRERIVDHPQLYLKAEDELGAGDESLDRQSALLRRDFEILSSVSWRARRRLEQGVLGAVGVTRRARLVRSYEEARHGFSSLSARMQEEKDAGPRHSSCDLAPPS